MADLTSKVLGYRYWCTDADDWDDYEDGSEIGCGLLYSQGHRGWVWGLGVNEATCEHGDHVAPAHNCQCGLHAYFEPQITPKRGPFKVSEDEVYGCVRGWGQMEVHCNGYRAQYVEVVALGYNDHLPKRRQNVVKTLARDYEVEAVPLSKLTAFAVEQAEPMPKELVPEKPKPQKAEATKAGNSLAAFASALRFQYSSPSLAWEPRPLPPLKSGPTLESIGLHTPQPGDILNVKPPF